MKILDLFGKKDASSELNKTLPYRIMTEFTPYKLYANRRNSVMLLLEVTIVLLFIIDLVVLLIK